MAVDAYEALKQFIEQLISDPQAAAQYAEDPYGTLAAQGITDNDLTGLDVRQVAGDAAQGIGVAPETREALQEYCGGGYPAPDYPVHPPAPGEHYPQPVDEIVQHLNYITYTTYEGDEYITQTITQVNQEIDQSTNIDNSTTVDVDGNVHGDIDVDATNANALDGGIAGAGSGDVIGSTGHGDVNAATGDRAQVIDGDNYGQANTGDGAVQVGGYNDGPINTGENTGIVGDDNQAVIGDHNQTAQVDGHTDDTVFNFGDGSDIDNVNDNQVTDGALSTGGDANNASHNYVDDGSAVAAGGDAYGYNSDVDQHIDVDVDAHAGGYTEHTPKHEEYPQQEEYHHPGGAGGAGEHVGS